MVDVIDVVDLADVQAEPDLGEVSDAEVLAGVEQGQAS